MARKARGVSLDHLSDYYDTLTPTERSKFRRKQIDLVGLGEGVRVGVAVGWGRVAVAVASIVVVGVGVSVAGKAVCVASSYETTSSSAWTPF